MLNPTTHELVFIRTCVFILAYLPFIIPFLPPPFWLLLPVEGLYYFFILRPFERRLSHSARHPPYDVDRKALFQRCLDNVPDPERYLSLWALGAHPDDIKRDNVRDFLLWAFFDRDSLTPEIEDELEEYISRTEELLGRPLAPGRGRATPMRLTFDHVHTRYRSVAWYITVGLVDSATHCHLLWHGFEFWPSSLRTSLLHVFPPRLLASAERFRRQSPSDELCYWYRRPQGLATATLPTLPIVFLHGIGIGLYPYVSFLASLPPTSPILALEILPISMRLTKSNILARPDFILHLKKILQYHNIDRFVLVGHSYGTVMATHVLHDPQLSLRVEAVMLVDPVTLLLHLPDVAYNFTRRTPRTANEWQLWYLASMDPGIALVLGRHFFWRENIIFKDELVAGRQAAVCLSSRDLIVDTMAVARYLISDDDNDEVHKVLEAAKKSSVMTSSGIELLWVELDHAQVFDKSHDYTRIVETIRRFVIQ
ncbi:hypothetical protein N8I77_012730 [Diaporthe amygdali]|uniref:AB hydrolase-1 domain-containing protein n=1 Tax=Phomopsis amygdali TaxID=1214568 RepID=A0AAD9VX14_PHOAM|nr:hypothetical protein N8I77_012730 [Diaporthe amygdali]